MCEQAAGATTTRKISCVGSCVNMYVHTSATKVPQRGQEPYLTHSPSFLIPCFLSSNLLLIDFCVMDNRYLVAKRAVEGRLGALSKDKDFHPVIGRCRVRACPFAPECDVSTRIAHGPWLYSASAAVPDLDVGEAWRLAARGCLHHRQCPWPPLCR